MNKLSEQVKRKFINEYNINDYEIETDEGFVDIEKLLITVKYEKYYLKTKKGLELFCADDHILFDEFYNEKFAKNFMKNEKIITQYGVDVVEEIYSTKTYENMYDLQLSKKSKHRYYTNGILSHNTFLAKKIAEEIYGSDKDLVRIDMSEYSESHSVSKLIGANPSYVGYENGGQLTEAIKHKPHCVLLLDEIEKANKEVYNIFLQLFDEGRLTDNSGQIVNFKNVLVIMTSNVGTKEATEMGNGIGFNNNTNNQQHIIDKQIKNKFTPEFLNRLDQIVYFNALSDDNLKNIVKLELNKFIKRLNEINYNLEFTDDVINHLYDLSLKEKEYGARPIIRIIQHNVEDNITSLMLENEYENNYTFKAEIKNEQLVIA